MMTQQTLVRDGVDFRSVVKDCAQEAEIIAAFNRACGMQLGAPVTALLYDGWPDETSEEEAFQIGCFVVFIHENIWRRFTRARTRMERAARSRAAGRRRRPPEIERERRYATVVQARTESHRGP